MITNRARRCCVLRSLRLRFQSARVRSTTSNDGDEHPPSLLSSWIQTDFVFDASRTRTEFTDDFLQQQLAFVQDQLHAADQEPFGSKDRGLEVFRQQLANQKENPEFSLTAAKSELRILIHSRHALLHKACNLKELRRKCLAKTFLGRHSEASMPLKTAQTILRELWQHGKSPVLEQLKEKEAKAQQRIRT